MIPSQQELTLTNAQRNLNNANAMANDTKINEQHNILGIHNLDYLL